ncbi:MAG: helix-turn-helix domain-containing protein [Gammaproteobacteria bacterium]
MNTRQSQTSTTPIPVPGAESLGAILRATRIAQHLEPKDISDRLRMNLSIIQALETDDYKALGAPVFARMYLLRYSQLLDLPEHEVLARYKALGLDEPPPLHVAHPIRPQTRMRDIRWISYPLVLALVITAGMDGPGAGIVRFQACRCHDIGESQRRA